MFRSLLAGTRLSRSYSPSTVFEPRRGAGGTLRSPAELQAGRIAADPLSRYGAHATMCTVHDRAMPWAAEAVAGLSLHSLLHAQNAGSQMESWLRRASATWPPGTYCSAGLTKKPRPDSHRPADDGFRTHQRVVRHRAMFLHCVANPYPPLDPRI